MICGGGGREEGGMGWGRGRRREGRDGEEGGMGKGVQRQDVKLLVILESGPFTGCNGIL